MSAAPESSIVEFGSFSLDIRQPLLMRSGEVIPLEPKVVETLVVLVEADGRLVTKQELMERVWPGTFVEEGSLARNVSALRRVLGDTAEEPRFIETVTRRGYRFCAPIRRHATVLSAGLPAPRRSWFYGAVAAALLLLATFAAFWHARSGEASVRRVRSMAVLPLRNFTGRPDLEFVADGTTEELISTLAQISSIRVIGHRSVAAYKNATKPAGVIARELGVDAVLEGGVRESNGRLRVSASLIDSASETSLWARTQEGSVQDLLAIQEEIAKAVASVVARGDGARALQVARRRTTSPAAYEEILKGQAFRWRDFDADARQSIAHFQRATEFDPQSAIAYAYLSGSWQTLSGSSGVEPARQAAERALALDRDLPEAHLAMADVYYRDHDWEAGYAESQRTLALSPNAVDVCYCFIVKLAWAGRDHEAVDLAQQGLARNPRSPLAHEALGLALYWARRYKESIPEFRRTLELDPTMFTSRLILAYSLSAEGRSDESVKLLDTPALRHTPFMAVMKLRTGHREEGLRLMRELTAATPPVEANFMAISWANFGDRDQAISWLTRAVESREQRAPGLIDQGYDSLRADARFADLARRLKMPASFYDFLRAKGVG